MDRNGQVRKEPTLADLDAFEKLLRESLHAEPVREPKLAQPAAPAATPVQPQNADQAAMAELARLVETPLDFENQLRGSIAPHAEPQVQEYQVQEYQAPEYPAHEAIPPAIAAEADDFHQHSQDSLHPHGSVHSHGSMEVPLAETWAAPPVVEAQYAAHHAPVPTHAPEQPAASIDPLAAFEEELRRFDAIRASDVRAAPAVADSAYPAQHAEQNLAGTYEQEIAALAQQGQPVDPGWYQEPASPPPDYTAESRAESSLNAAEERLAAEAAAAAASAGAAQNSGRSKGIFLALGGIVVAGLAVIGGSLVFGPAKKGGTSGDVPTIAARTEPTKEKPADPGGMEIPNQNKQVLASRNTPETKPAAVVNNTEQPLDLNQVTKRDSVRVIAPSPYQTSQPAGGAPTTLEAAPPTGAAVEPRRVTSVKIPVNGSEGAASAPTPSIAGATAGGAAIAAIAAGTSARASSPAPTPPSVQVPSQAASALAPTKVESRPVTAAQPRPETPKVTPPPKVATAPTTTTAPKATPPKTTPPKNAPLSLSPPKTTVPARTAATGGSGGYAIQLASRPTEADARSASTQLKSRYSSTLGSRSPGVVSGEANGQTVYRVRVGGYSQADAVAACTKIKAAGGGCFVTKQ